MMEIPQDRPPADRRYTAEHEWVRPEGGVLLLGITAYAAGKITEVGEIEAVRVLVRRGERVRAGRVYASIDTRKMCFDVVAPVGGLVARRNRDLGLRPALLGEDPYHRGWLVAIRPRDPAVLGGLLDAAAYEEAMRRDDGSPWEER